MPIACYLGWEMKKLLINICHSGTEIATPRITGAKKLLLLLTILIQPLDLWHRRVGITGK